ncbi:MAG: tetratricopeptide repeat protein [Acidimicrobiales bacterium]|nr:tetratricopeptide repeat protein [Acidimicrobiales bacterium]
MTQSTMTAPERERLRTERDHLLLSLDDLDAEYAAGDIDELDYRALHDDYVARAASLTRALESSTIGSRSTSGPTSSTLLWVGGVVVLALVAGFAMARFSGGRGAGETASGEIRQSTAGLLSEAAAAFTGGDTARAIETYGEVLAIQPTNTEALTYRGWLQYQTGDVESAQADFDEAVLLDADYPDVRVFRAVLALDVEDFETAAEELAAFDAAEPSPIAEQLVTQRQLRERIAIGRVLALGDVVVVGVDGVRAEDALLAGRTFIDLGRPADALRMFDAMLEADPESAAAFAWRGWTLGLSAESGAPELFPDAIMWLDRAIEVDPAYPDAYVFRAFLHRRLDQPELAAIDVRAYDDLGVEVPYLTELMEQFALRDVLTG